MENTAVGSFQKEPQKCRACGSELKLQSTLDLEGPFKDEPFMFCTQSKCPLMGSVIRDHSHTIIKKF